MSELLVLGCSSRKTMTPGETPALHRYDGPFYQDFRSRLRTHVWPRKLDVAVLSAQYGMIGALTEIPHYDLRMSPQIARDMAPKLAEETASWTETYDRINLCLGKDYLAALPTEIVKQTRKTRVFPGPIGEKRQRLGEYLRSLDADVRESYSTKPIGRMSYFLPDWDDLIDPNFDFLADKFSGPKTDRNDVHCARLMRPHKIADGILVSLAQKRAAKGPLRFVGGIDPRTLNPIDLREHYGLNRTQALFGDCGAFSYVNENEPPISVDYAVSLYELYNFDFGASVDHIPVPAIKVDDETQLLSRYKRRKRVETTIQNAEDFLAASKRRRVGFAPVGIVQGLSPKEFARNANLYADMGYRRIALGGLVPLPDNAILDIVRNTMKSLRQLRSPPEVHLFGVFRPKLQAHFRALGVTSFDSATYFRKAWLRSEQNYLAANGEWYAAIRVPMTSDGRTRNAMLGGDYDLKTLEKLEAKALHALHRYADGKLSLKATIAAITDYDEKLDRSSVDRDSVKKRYERTLRDRPWEHCPCRICRNTGIDVLIFRGSNRNKRRGAHNTWMLYQATRRTQKMSFAEAMGDML